MLLPPPIVATISKESPVIGSTHVECENWLKFYDNFVYRTTVFYKGPLLVMSPKLEENLSPASYITMKAEKNNIKCAILDQQGSYPVAFFKLSTTKQTWPQTVMC